MPLYILTSDMSERSTLSPEFRVSTALFCLDHGVREIVFALACKFYRKLVLFVGHRVISLVILALLFSDCLSFYLEITTYVIVVINQSISND